MRSEGSPHFYKAPSALLHSAAPDGSARYRKRIRNLWNLWNLRNLWNFLPMLETAGRVFPRCEL